jgi:hypothetical protein
VRNATFVCRASVGVCDVADTCDSIGKQCGTDRYRDSSVVCRDAANQCDRRELCSGASPFCPSDQRLAVGSPCNDGDDCTSPRHVHRRRHVPWCADVHSAGSLHAGRRGRVR